MLRQTDHGLQILRAPEANMSEQFSESDFPGIELAYPIARESYEVLIKRLDGLDGRIQSMIAYASTVTLAIPAITAGKGLSYKSPLFIAAMIIFVAAISIGIYARLRGVIKIVSPRILFEHHLNSSEWQFKKDFIFYAGENQDLNNKLMFWRSKMLNLMSFLLLVEVVLLAAWAAG